MSTRTIAARKTDPSTSVRRGLVVRIEAGPGGAKSEESAAGPVVIGRADGVEIRVADPKVSQFHAELDATDEGVIVKDLGSTNGTWLGEVAVERAVVPAGSQLRIGDTTLVVDLGPPAPPRRSKATAFGPLVGASAVMRETYAHLERLAASHDPVLLEGEPGTGKSIAARALHENGPRKDKAFIVVDCVALAPNVAAALFARGPDGVFTAAAGGTMFFDEIAVLSPDLQEKLRVAIAEHEEDVRFLCSTSRRLRELVNGGGFSEDLYLQLAKARVKLPALREHAEDIKPLVQHFLTLIPEGEEVVRAIDAGALDTLVRRNYAGNVRELRHIVERAARLAEGGSVTADDVAFERMIDAPIEPFKEAKRTIVDEFERDYLARLLARSGTNVSRAAALAGIERQSLRDLLKRHGLRDEG
ncbi:MAG: sigma 54-interacting transcriptional regulator [Labilithrix sp.]|nr:sigma 54-interacting transcriptional regulator [Labilithrix sp.]MCW5809391.1 sigma 54-interacting transcriptional regulator [Labilithrix sp.]